ncbi:hypothetical protein M0765_023665 [Variovorax sp. S2]|uniref:hypothetical protein n=1 Tax=Variovorax sp. S12S4 TaxID=3029170 RepID=UPI00215B9517|nr:hypothetical protein [Variovorax sp. S12S4]MCR8960616.1 hypothetical protein [Variovorax sp. S12S4]
MDPQVRTSVGAVWSLCSPEMGLASVQDRFRQIEPKVLVAVDGYRFGGKPYDRRAPLDDILGALPTVSGIVWIPHLDSQRACPRRWRRARRCSGKRRSRHHRKRSRRRYRPTTRSGSSTPWTRRACPRRSSTDTAASWPSYMALFVQLRPGTALDAELEERIRRALRTALSARHVPNEILQVPGVPKTIIGRKLELAVKKLLLGHAPEKVINRDVLAEPGCIDWYVAFARDLGGRLGGGGS